MSEFMKYVAQLMKYDGEDPEDPKKVQGYIDKARRLIRDEYERKKTSASVQEVRSLYELRMEGAIEEQKHLQLYGDLYS